MKNKIILSVLCITTLYSSENCNVSLDEIFTNTINKNPKIKLAQQNEEITQEQINNKFWSFFPTPTIQVNLKDNDNIEKVFTLEQPIWAGNKLTAEYEISKINKRLASTAVNQEIETIMLEVLNISNENIVLNKKIDYLVEIELKLNELKNLMERKKLLGESSIIDEKILESKIKSIITEKISLNTQLLINKKKLQLKSNIKPNCLINDIQVAKIDESYEDLLDKTIKNSPKLKELKIEQEKISQEIQIEKSAYWPKLSVVGQYKKGSVYDSTDEDSQSSIYLSLSASTGAGLSAMTRVNERKIEKLKNKSKQNDIINTITEEFNKDYNIYKNSILEMQNVEEEIQLAWLIFESNKRLYKEDKKDYLDLVSSLMAIKQLMFQKEDIKSNYKFYSTKIAIKKGAK